MNQGFCVKKKTQKQQAFAMLEYVLLMIVIITALAAFSSYIQRGMQGQYRKSGETFGYGRQYSAYASLECAFDDKANVWYSVACFNNQILLDHCKNSADYFTCARGTMNKCTLGCN